jgi:hypothetical protein
MCARLGLTYAPSMLAMQGQAAWSGTNSFFATTGAGVYRDGVGRAALLRPASGGSSND